MARRYISPLLLSLAVMVALVSTANAAYVKPNPLIQDFLLFDKVTEEIKDVIEEHSNAIDEVAARYRFLQPITNASKTKFEAELGTVLTKYYSSDADTYSPVDGYFTKGLRALIRWYGDMFRMYGSVNQWHGFGSYRFRRVSLVPSIIEVVTTQHVTGSAILPPVPGFPSPPYNSSYLGLLGQTHLQHSTLLATLVFQLRKEGRGAQAKWVITYKSEDFARLSRHCNGGYPNCAAINPVGCAPFVQQLMALGVTAVPHCSLFLTNWNLVLNPLYPPPAGYVALNNPPIVYQ